MAAAPLAASPWFSMTGAAVNRYRGSGLLPQYFKCVSWVQFCVSSRGGAPRSKGRRIGPCSRVPSHPDLGVTNA